MAPVADPGSLGRAWWTAARPATLWAGCAPVAVGTAVASWEGGARAAPALAALAGALLLQLSSNFANDVYDFERGVDTDERLGPPRATQQGWISPASMKRAMAGALAAAGAVGLYLVACGGWPIAIVGTAALVAAWAYTGGPWPLGYHGLGDVAVFAFFGVVAVTGTAYVQAGALSHTALCASLPVGVLATAILVVNNLRDIETDARAGKRTLAVRIGTAATRAEYAALLATAFVWPAVAIAAGVAPLGVAVTWLAMPLGWSLWKRLARARGAALNPLLAGTARLLAVYSVLLALGFVGSPGTGA